MVTKLQELTKMVETELGIWEDDVTDGTIEDEDAEFTKGYVQALEIVLLMIKEL